MGLNPTASSMESKLDRVRPRLEAEWLVRVWIETTALRHKHPGGTGGSCGEARMARSSTVERQPHKLKGVGSTPTGPKPHVGKPAPKPYEG